MPRQLVSCVHGVLSVQTHVCMCVYMHAFQALPVHVCVAVAFQAWHGLGITYRGRVSHFCTTRCVLCVMFLYQSPRHPWLLGTCRCARHLSDALRSGSPAGKGVAPLLLRLLVVWLAECPQAITAFLSHASHLPMIVDLITGKLGGSDATVPGLAAVLMGVCLLYGPPSASKAAPGQTAGPEGANSDTVLDVLMSRIGLSAFFSRLDDLRRVPSFVAASASPRLPKPVTRAVAMAATAGDAAGAGGEEGGAVRVPGPPSEQGATEAGAVFDHAFTVYISEVEELVKARAMHAFAQPAGHAPKPGSSTVGGGAGAGWSRTLMACRRARCADPFARSC